jgi:hypothetical protein
MATPISGPPWVARWPARLAVGVGCVVLGLGTGVPMVLLHGSWPGFAIGAAATIVVVRAVPPERGLRLLFIGGFLVVVWLGAVPRPEGDYLIASDVPGYAVLGGALLLLCVGLWTGIAAWGRSDRPDARIQ